MSDFLTLIRQEHQRGQEVQKSAGSGRVIRPDESVDEHTFTPVVMAGLRARFASQQRPQYKGVRTLDRRPTFVDVVIGQSRGLDVAEKSAHDDWATEDLSDIVDDFLDFLDSTK